MRIEGTLDDMKIIGPALRPYKSREFTVCPACGIAASGRWRRILRKLKGKRDEVVVTMRYCQGDKPPIEERKPSMLDIFSFSSGEIINGCSGIPEPHLHCSCDKCGAKWYTALKEHI